jgi:hypothetical protein
MIGGYSSFYSKSGSRSRLFTRKSRSNSKTMRSSSSSGKNNCFNKLNINQNINTNAEYCRKLLINYLKKIFNTDKLKLDSQGSIEISLNRANIQIISLFILAVFRDSFKYQELIKLLIKSDSFDESDIEIFTKYMKSLIPEIRSIKYVSDNMTIMAFVNKYSYYINILCYLFSRDSYTSPENYKQSLAIQSNLVLSVKEIFDEESNVLKTFRNGDKRIFFNFFRTDDKLVKCAKIAKGQQVIDANNVSESEDSNSNNSSRTSRRRSSSSRRRSSSSRRRSSSSRSGLGSVFSSRSKNSRSL